MVTGADIYALMEEGAQLSDMRQIFPQRDHSEIYEHKAIPTATIVAV